MKRLSAAIAALLLMWAACCGSAAAASQRLSLEYVQRSEHGAIFYLDIAYDGSLSAATLLLSYNPSLVEYREISAVSDAAAVKAEADGGKLTIVIGSSSTLSGGLARVTFKSLGDGTVTFSLRMTEGVDGDLRRVELPAVCERSYSFFGISSSDGSHSSSGSSRSASDGHASYAGAGSSKSIAAAPDSATGDESPAGSALDLRSDKPDNKTLIILGVAAGTCAALLVAFGFLIGRKTRRTKKPADESGEEE